MDRVRLGDVSVTGVHPTASVTIVTVAHDVADARLHRLYHALVGADLDVDLVGLGERSGAPDPHRTRVLKRAGTFRRGLRSVTAPFRYRSPVLILIDPDPVAGALVARTLGLVEIVVSDVHEDYEQLVRDRDWPVWVVGLACRLSRLLVRLASLADVTIVADDHVPPMHARQRRVVANVPVRRASSTEQRREWSLVYVGDVRTSRGLEMMLDAIDLTDGWTLDVVGPINADADRELLEARSKADGRITWWGRQPPSETFSIMTRSQVGLCLLSETPAFVESMPSKIYDYMNAGLAVITTPLPRPAAFVAEAGVGAVARSAEDVAECLRAWRMDPERLRMAQDRAAEWSRTHLPSTDGFATVASEIAALRSGASLS